MATSEIKAALESQQARGISKIDPITIPGFGPATPDGSFDPNKYSVRYCKIDFDDIASITDLEILETKAIRNQGVYILSKEKFVFMDKCYLIVGYLESTPSSAIPITKKE